MPRIMLRFSRLVFSSFTDSTDSATVSTTPTKVPIPANTRKMEMSLPGTVQGWMSP